MGSFTHTDNYEGSLNLFLCISHRQKHDLAVLCKILVQNVSQFLRVFHHTESMDASIDPILPITVVVIPASVTFYEGFEHAVLDAVGVVGLIRPPVGVLSYRVAFVPTKFSCKQKSKALNWISTMFCTWYVTIKLLLKISYQLSRKYFPFLKNILRNLHTVSV